MGARPGLYGRGFRVDRVMGRWVSKRAGVTVEFGNVLGELSADGAEVELQACLRAPVSIEDAFGGCKRVTSLAKKPLLGWGRG